MTGDGEALSTVGRILDNTLPQSALHFVHYGKDQALDITAKNSFNIFVDAFVNTPDRKVVLPASIIGKGDSFIQLWQDGAEKLTNAGPSLDDPQQERAVNAYASSLGELGPQWAGFLAFQFTDKIGFQYRSRVRDWPVRLEQAVEQIRSSADRLPAIARFQSQALMERATPLREGGTPHKIDDEYVGWQRSRGLDLPTFMIAYGLDWFRRGYSYSHSASNNWWGWHELRKDAAYEIAAQGASTPFEGEPEVKWSSILVASIDRGILPADEVAIVDLLRRLRSHIHDKETGFAKNWRQANLLEDPVQRSLRARNVVVDALLKVGISPQKRVSGGASQVEALMNAVPLLAKKPPRIRLQWRFALVERYTII